MNASPGTVSRRRFLGGGAAAVLSTAAGATVLAGCSSESNADAGDVQPTTPHRQRFAFEGAHQIGITTPAQEHAIVCAFDSVAQDPAALQAMFATLTVEVRDLLAGTPAPVRDPLLPPSDNLIVG